MVEKGPPLGHIDMFHTSPGPLFCPPLDARHSRRNLDGWNAVYT